MTSSSVSEAIVAFARNTAIPDVVIDCARLRLIDSIGVAIGGRDTPPSRTVLAAANAAFGPGDCGVMGSRERLAPGGAALVNGALVHTLDFDDTYLAGSLHTSAAVIGAALAAADVAGASLDRLLRGVAIGTEVGCFLSTVKPGEFHRRGFLPTAVLGAIGGAIAAAGILGLDDAAFANAIGLASNVAAGTFQLEESWAKNWNGGWAAQTGIAAALMARAGYLGPRLGLDGPRGLFATHIGVSGFDADALAPEGEWRSQIIAMKRYPCCHFLQSSIDCALQLAGKVVPGKVEKIIAQAPPLAVIAVTPPKEFWARPLSEYRARFSGHWVLARAFLDRRIDLATFDEYRIEDARIDDLVARTEIIEHDFENFPRNWPTRIEIHNKDGSVVVHQDEGEPVAVAPRNRALVEGKFLDNLRYAGLSQEVGPAIMAVLADAAAPVGALWAAQSERRAAAE